MADSYLFMKLRINSLAISQKMHFTDDGCPHHGNGSAGTVTDIEYLIVILSITVFNRYRYCASFVYFYELKSLY